MHQVALEAIEMNVPQAKSTGESSGHIECEDANKQILENENDILLHLESESDTAKTISGSPLLLHLLIPVINSVS